MTTQTATKTIYSTALILATLTIWTLLYKAQFLGYDDNYGNILLSFFISIVSTMILTIIWFKWRHIIKTYVWQTILFLIVSSPLTIALVSINYSKIFGTMLKN